MSTELLGPNARVEPFLVTPAICLRENAAVQTAKSTTVVTRSNKINMDTDLKSHRLADCFPMLPESEIQDLAEDIEVFGLREKIVLFEGRILDGRNRYAACQKVGTSIENSITYYDGSDPIGYVISANLKRRHLNAGQRAAIASELANAKVGGRHSPNSVNEKTVGQIANEMHVSPTSVTTLRAIAIANPEVADEVKAGKINLNRAAKVAGIVKKKAISGQPEIGTSAPEAVALMEKPLEDDLSGDPWWKDFLPQELDDKQERRLKTDLENSVNEFMAGADRFIASWEPHGDQAIDLLEEEFTRWLRKKKPATASKIVPAQAMDEQKEAKDEEPASELITATFAGVTPESTPSSGEANTDLTAESIEPIGYMKEKLASSENIIIPPSKKKETEEYKRGREAHQRAAHTRANCGTREHQLQTKSFSQSAVKPESYNGLSSFDQ
jgi:hypothetical protein